MHTHRGVQGGVPLVGLPQAGRLQLLVAVVALQLTLLARSAQKGPSFQEGPHRQQEQGPQLLEPQLDHGPWEAQQPQAVVWAGSLGAGLVAAAAAAGASAGSAAAGPSSLRTSAAPCGRPAGQPGAAASGTPAASANRIRSAGPDPWADTSAPLFLLEDRIAQAGVSPRQTLAHTPVHRLLATHAAPHCTRLSSGVVLVRFSPKL